MDNRSRILQALVGGFFLGQHNAGRYAPNHCELEHKKHLACV
jgi:hypothetical protein